MNTLVRLQTAALERYSLDVGSNSLAGCSITIVRVDQKQLRRSLSRLDNYFIIDKETYLFTFLKLGSLAPK